MEIKNIKIEKLKIAKYNPRLDLQPEDKEYQDMLMLAKGNEEYYIDDKGILRSSNGSYKGQKSYIGTCKRCGKLFISHKPRLNCSRSCAMSFPRPYAKNNFKSAKARKRTRKRNKDPEFRKKVSEGLKKRKERLGENYHSKETKAKIGKATRERWEKVKEKILPILIWNGNNLRKRDGFPCGSKWRKISEKARSKQSCSRCKSNENLCVHHIIPARFGGKHDDRNIMVLCNHCHGIVDKQQLILYDLFRDWEIVRACIVNVLFRRLKTWK